MLVISFCRSTRSDSSSLHLYRLGMTKHGSIRTPTELTVRRQRLSSVLENHGLEAIWLARPNNFAWLTGGSNVVDRDASVGVAAAGYQRDGNFRILTDTIEADRLRREELPDAFEVTAVDWYAASLGDGIAAESPTPAAADFDVPGLWHLDCSACRQPLTEPDIERYRHSAGETAAAVEDVCRSLSSDQSERSVAASVRHALETRGIATPVVLVGGSERAQQYRHYTPTTAALGDYALVSVTAQLGGLYASLTRTVVFERPEWLDERFEAAATVEATALAATQRAARDGANAARVFEAIKGAYETVGWAEEWQQHHQGGAAGFAGREWIATPDSTATVQTPQAYAWNPTVQGTKSEGTVLVTSECVEPLTITSSWPTISASAVESTARDWQIERPAPLAI